MLIKSGVRGGRGYWIAKDGEKLFPKDFEDQHLINTIKHMRDNARRWKNQEELSMAVLMSNEVYTPEYNMSIEEWLEYTVYPLLVEEARKRNLIF